MNPVDVTLPPSPPLKIGPILVDPPVVLAPMAGVTNAAFRRLCRSYGGGLFVSEMITARALLEDNPKTHRMASFAPDEPVRSIQLYGVDPKVMTAAVRHLVNDDGADHIDLNFGCPAAKVTRKGGGAALPAHPLLFGSIIRAAIDAAGAVPITIKMRLGIDAENLTALQAARIAEDEGVAAITVHARTAEQLYSGKANWTAITEIKASITSIPVLGNGDIWQAHDAIDMMTETGCDGVVIGRGCLGRPWLFRDLAAALRNEPTPTPPSLSEVCAIMGEHAILLCDALGEFSAMNDFRKHVDWYLAGFPVGRKVRSSLTSVTSLVELCELLDDVAEHDMAFPPEALAMTRGPRNGPRRVALPERWLETTDDPNPPVGAEAFVSGG
ncbi:MAG: tRNA dihydrouridine synthase DusB [Acidimicrobiales bacterium]